MHLRFGMGVTKISWSPLTVILSEAKNLREGARQRPFATLRACPERSEGVTNRINQIWSHPFGNRGFSRTRLKARFQTVANETGSRSSVPGCVPAGGYFKEMPTAAVSGPGIGQVVIILVYWSNVITSFLLSHPR